jgi:putative transposase
MPGQTYVVTSTTLHRVPWFTDFEVAAAAIRGFVQRDLGSHDLLAWVLMPDHVHWLVQLADASTLDAIVNRLKSASAREANRALMRRGAFWAPAFHDHALRSDEALASVAEYIIRNPIRAGLARTFGSYPFWDSAWLPEVE